MEDREAVIMLDQNRLKALSWASTLAIPMTLRSLVLLGIPDLMVKGGQDATFSAQQLADCLPSTHPKAASYLNRMLRLLASHGIFTETLHTSNGQTERRYGLTPVGRYFSINEESGTFAPLLLMNQEKVFVEAWQYLHEVVLDGVEPFIKAHGKPSFEHAKDDKHMDDLFNKVMANHSKIYLSLIVDVYDGFKDVTSLVDVGGGIGTSLRVIIAKYPHIKGINFDQPHVLTAAIEFPGIDHVGGDMFVSVPKGDAMFMKWILHDWDDERCILILRNCHQALPEKGKVIVVDAVLPEGSASSEEELIALTGDLRMLTYNSGGRERTLRELADIATAAGFTKVLLAARVDTLSVVELHKA